MTILAVSDNAAPSPAGEGGAQSLGFNGSARTMDSPGPDKFNEWQLRYGPVGPKGRWWLFRGVANVRYIDFSEGVLNGSRTECVLCLGRSTMAAGLGWDEALAQIEGPALGTEVGAPVSDRYGYRFQVHALVEILRSTPDYSRRGMHSVNASFLGETARAFHLAPKPWFVGACDRIVGVVPGATPAYLVNAYAVLADPGGGYSMKQLAHTGRLSTLAFSSNQIMTRDPSVTWCLENHLGNLAANRRSGFASGTFGRWRFYDNLAVNVPSLGQLEHMVSEISRIEGRFPEATRPVIPSFGYVPGSDAWKGALTDLV